MSRNAFFLEPTPPFRLDLTVWTLRRRPDNAIDRWDGTTYRRALALANGPVEVAVVQTGPPEAPRLRVTVHGGSAQPRGEAGHDDGPGAIARPTHRPGGVLSPRFSRCRARSPGGAIPRHEAAAFSFGVRGNRQLDRLPASHSYARHPPAQPPGRGPQPRRRRGRRASPRVPAARGCGPAGPRSSCGSWASVGRRAVP